MTYEVQYIGYGGNNTQYELSRTYESPYRLEIEEEEENLMFIINDDLRKEFSRFKILSIEDITKQ